MSKIRQRKILRREYLRFAGEKQVLLQASEQRTAEPEAQQTVERHVEAID